MSLDVGDLFSAEIAHVTNSGTGSVRVGNTTISIGPVTCEKGDHVHLRYLGEREENNMTTNFAICLSDDAINSAYEKYLDNIIDLLTPDGPPSAGEVTYARVNRFDSDGIAYANLGDIEISLGPIDADLDGFVQIEGYSNAHARVLTDSVKDESYDLQFKILTGQIDDLPISLEEEYTTAIAEFSGEIPIAYIKNIPVRLPECEAQLGQKIDVRIDGFESLHAVGEVLELHDEVSRIDNPGHWARMQWLKESGYGEEPFIQLASDFIGVSRESLPDESDRLKTALIGEAFRLALADKASASSESFPRAHISGLRHWVSHKISTIIGDPNDESEDSWLQDTLREGQGPTLTFLGDVMELSDGYYASGPTRAVLVGDDDAVLISGKPTREFTNRGFNVEIRGLSRILTDTTETELNESGIEIQSLSAYTGNDDRPHHDLDYLEDFIESREAQPWAGDESWKGYSGSGGYGFDWDDTPIEVLTDDGCTVSFWKAPVQYGADEYYLQIDGGHPDNLGMVHVPIQYYKQICLIFDDEVGVPRRVEFSETPEGIHLQCNFSPPKPQMRWLTAIGSQWRGYRQGSLHWLIEPSAIESVVESFQNLPVTVTNELNNNIH